MTTLKEYSQLAKAEELVLKVVAKSLREIMGGQILTVDDESYILLEAKEKDAPYVAILHGFSDMPESFLVFARFLNTKYNVIVPYLAGFADTNFDRTIQFNLDFYTDNLKKVLAHCNVKKLHLIGHSLGGGISLEFYKRYSDMVEGMTLISPMGMYRRGVSCVANKVIAKNNPFLVSNWDEYKKFISLTMIKDKIPFFMKHRMYEYMVLNSEKFAKIISDLFTSFKHDPVETNYLVTPEQIKVPTSFIWGREDRIFPLLYGKEFVERNESLKLFTLENCGHNPHLERPFEMFKILKRRLL